MTRQLSWTGADGVTTIFNGSAGIDLLADPVGLEAPNPTLTVDDYIAFDGGVLANRRRSSRTIALKLYIQHATRVETVVGQLAAMLQGPGTLTYSDAVNTRTLKKVVYEAGLDGSGQSVGSIWRIAVVSLLALDPWWYGPANNQALSVAASTAFDAAVAFDLFLPFDGGSTVGVTIVGDAGAYPVITVIGPATTLTIGTGSLQWSIASALGASDVLVVDHRPGSRGPSKNGGLVDWSLLTEASRLWTLAAGTTSVVSGSTGSTGATSVSMVYEPRFLTP